MSGLGVEEGRIMSVCPRPSRKYEAFEPAPLAQGLQTWGRMQNGFLSLITCATLLLPAASALGQDPQQDAITRIDDVNQESQVFFNASHCNDPANTEYILTLANFDGVREAFLWVGGQQDNCQSSENRNDNIPPICAPLADSQSRVLGPNGNITELPLQELLDTGVVNCENGATTGEAYELYAFRNTAPGTTDVTGDGYGVAAFKVDVVPPLQLTITNLPEVEGSSFTLSWNSPVDDENVPQYRVYRSDTGNPEDVGDTPIATTGQGSNSITISAGSLQLEDGAATFLLVSAVDNAATNVGDGNEGPLSEPTRVIGAATFGFCDDPNVDCSGCSVSPLRRPDGQPGSGLWVVGLVFAIVLGWRLRR